MALFAKKPKLPKNLAEVLKSRELLAKFEQFCKSEHSLENFTFLTLKSWNAQNLYKIYFSKSGKYELNLPADQMKVARELGEKKAWDDKGWKKVHENALKEITKLVERDAFKRFLKGMEEGKI